MPGFRGVFAQPGMTVIANGFNLMHWDTTYQQVVTGVLILAAVAADSLFFRRQSS